MDFEEVKKELRAMDYETSFSKLALDIAEGVISDSGLPEKVKDISLKFVDMPRKAISYMAERGLPII